MQPKPIDNELIRTTGKGISNPLLRWTALILLWAGIVFCISAGLTSSPKVIAAVVLLLLSTALTYFKPDSGIKITLAVIVLGVLGLLTFSPSNYSVGISIGSFQPSIELLPLLVGIIHYFTNREVLTTFFKSFLNRSISEESVQAIERSKINGFRKRYARKSLKELNSLSTNMGLLPEARKAAEELLEERN